MAATTGIEAVLNACVTKLNAGLAAQLASIQAECADGIALDVPAGVSISTRSEIPGWPWIMVLPETSDLEYDPGTEVTRVHRVSVFSWCMDYDEATLALKLLRTQRAVFEVLIANRRPAAEGDSSGYSLRWEGDKYGSAFQEQEQGFYYQCVQSRFAVKQFQTI